MNYFSKWRHRNIILFRRSRFTSTSFLRLYFRFANLYLEIRCFLLYAAKFRITWWSKSNKPSFEFNFLWPLEVARKLLEEFPEAIEFVKTFPKELPSVKIDGLFSNVTKRLITSYENKEYYLGIKQSTVYGNYYICLIRRNLSDQRELDTSFVLTIPAALALLSRLPAALLAADSHQELCWAKEPRTFPLECTTTNMVWGVSKNKIYEHISLCDVFKNRFYGKPKTILLHSYMHVFNI